MLASFAEELFRNVVCVGPFSSFGPWLQLWGREKPILTHCYMPYI